jgi:hypothetical protein
MSYPAMMITRGYEKFNSKLHEPNYDTYCSWWQEMEKKHPGFHINFCLDDLGKQTRNFTNILGENLSEEDRSRCQKYLEEIKTEIQMWKTIRKNNFGY